MAAGATIGSNHNSRSADGELVAGRGFWPGLCVSLKHNSVFASFCILAKGDYPSELNIPIPFSLISNDQSKNELIIMPAYWFQYNMYALARNSWKYADRDRRTDKTQLLEFDFIAPDTINEMLSAVQLFEKLADKKRLVANEKGLDKQDIFVEGFENGNRKVRIIKIREAYRIFRDMIDFHLANQLLNAYEIGIITSLADTKKLIPAKLTIDQWENIGGQLIRKNSVDKLIAGIRTGKMKSWDDVHAYYIAEGENYDLDKLIHSIAVWQKANGIDLKKKPDALKDVLQKAIVTKEWITSSIKTSRQKDYKNPFRKMVYESDEEMNAVLGSFNDNSFIREELEKQKLFKKRVSNLLNS